MLRYGGSFLFGFLCLILAITSHADVRQGYSWLASQQQLDGSVLTQSDIANATQATHEVLALQTLAGASLSVNRNAGKAFLAAMTYTDTETLAQALLQGVTQTPQGQSIALLLKSRQNSDGGFGNAVGAQSTPFDTYWAATALEASSGWSGAPLAQAVSYVLAKHSAQGGWAYQSDQSLYLTARMVSWLSRHTTYGGATAAVNSGSQYLANQIDGSTGLVGGDLFNSAVTLLALVDAGDTNSSQTLATALLAQQDVAGSWAQDSWTSALVLQALLKKSAADQGAAITQIGGRVVVSGSSEPLAGVTVSVIGQNGVQVVTGSDGRFLLAGVKAGSVNLAFSRNGYNPVSAGAVLQVGEQRAMGDVALAPGANTVLLSGVVTNDATTQPVVGAAVAVNADSVQTDSKGVFVLVIPVSASYQASIAASGYNTWSGALALVVGQNTVRVGLLPDGTVQNNQPSTVRGRVIDGATGAGLAGATVNAAGLLVTTSADGQFSLDNVARGTVSGSVMATGYQAIQFSYPFPAGSSGVLGDIALYATSTTQAPTSSTLHLQVNDAVSQLPVANASVTAAGKSASTDASGRAVISNISSNSFAIDVSAAGYLATQGQMNATGFGELYATVPLTPQAPPATSVSLSGKVTNLSGIAVAGATVNVPGTTASVVSAADGTYELNNIAVLDFVLRTAAKGYQASDRTIHMQAFGQYTADVMLQPSQGQDFAVEQVNAPDGTIHADQSVLVEAVVHNLSGQTKSVLVRGLVFDMSGVAVATLPVYIPSTQAVASTLDFAADESKTLSLPWNSAQWAASGYSVRVDVVEPGSMSRDLPNGVILASGADTLSIEASQKLSGGFDFNPPMSQAGQHTPVALNALVRNTGNVPLAAGDYALTIRDATGNIIHTSTVTLPALVINEIRTLDFGSWVPAAVGNMSVMLQKSGEPAAGSLTGSYYVGDVGSGNFTVDQHVFAEGSHTTPAHINLQGVDLSTATSTDPLYEEIKTALTKAADYSGPGAVEWQRSGDCMGCHVQSQSLTGLATAQNKAPIDTAQMKILFNAVMGDVSDAGATHTHGYWDITPSSFALWSLDAWPDREATYRTRVKQLGHLWSKRVQDGNAAYINPDYDTGWIRNRYPETIYAAIMPAIRHLISEKPNMPATAKRDYTVSQALASLPNNSVKSITAVGNDIYLPRTGGIDKYDVATRQTTTVFENPDYTVGFGDVVIDDGVMYATTGSTIVKITGETTSERMALVPETSGLSDIVKWNGAFYVSDYNNSRILRFDVSGNTWVKSVFAASGELGNPLGLVVDGNNQLVVANKKYRQILAYKADGSHQVLFDGLIMSPQYIQYSAQENVYYFTTGAGETGVMSGSAIYRGKPDGTIERLLEYNNVNYTYYNGLTYVGDVLYVGNSYDRTLHTFQERTFDDSVVDTVAASIPSILNYILNNPRNEQDIVLTAERLYVLQNLRPLITDEQQLASIDTLSATLNTYLRSTQHTDGGWPVVDNFQYQSEPSVTAWVGMALDTMNPPADDPVVIKAITFLLSQQQGDGSWNTGGVFVQNRLGNTGLVMDYLPIALDHIGGLDLNVDLQSRPDVQLSAFSIAPDATTPQPSGGVLYHWKIDGVTGAGRQIDFTASINNLQPGEVRPVADSALLQFRNSFTDDAITRELAVPTVEAINGVMLNISTDRSSYPANSVVQISGAFANAGIALDNAVIKSVIRTADGVVIEGLPDQTGITLAHNSTGQTTAQWNTGRYAAGGYQVFAQLLDGSNRVRAESVSAFTIATSDGNGVLNTSYATQVSTDKLSYTPFATVQLHSRVRNLAVNATQTAVLAKLVVTNSQDNTVFNKQWVVPGMAANGLLDYSDSLPLNDAVAGAYSVSLTLWDATVQQQLASSQYNFIVTADPLAYLRGSVTTSAATVVAGDALSCTDRIESRSQQVSVNATIETLLVRAVDQTVISTNSQNQRFSAAEISTRIRNIDTAVLVPGEYSCVLVAHAGNNTNTLGYANFTVTAADASDVELDISATIGQRGRLLVLLDAIHYTDALDGTSTAQQKAWLEPFLASQGWSYTITHNAADFARELATGQYVVYGLFANHITLPKSVQFKLAAVVENGEGLLMSGQFNRRNNHLEKTLGITLTGREQQATGALLYEHVLTANSEAETFNPAHKLDIDDAAGDVLAVWKGVSGQHGDGNGRDDGDDHHGGKHHGGKNNGGHQIAVTADHKGKGSQPDDDHHSDGHDNNGHDGDACDNDAGDGTEPAMIHHAYGTGHAVFAGFDLLDEATLANNTNSIYARLLAWSLKRVEPALLPRTENNALPLLVHVENQGSVTDVRYTLSMSGGAVVASNGWSNVGNGQWQYSQHLDQHSTVTLPLVYVTAGNTGAAVAQLLVETRPDASAAWITYTTETWPVAILP